MTEKQSARAKAAIPNYMILDFNQLRKNERRKNNVEELHSSKCDVKAGFLD
jgi:hypothetical protein